MKIIENHNKSMNKLTNEWKSQTIKQQMIQKEHKAMKRIEARKK